MRDIKIRTASTQDLPAILEIYSYYVLHTAITFEYDVPTPEEFRLRMEQTLRMYPYIVAEEDGNILGYAYAGPFKTRAAYNWSVETSIYVAKEARQKGIGTLLLAHLEALRAGSVFTGTHDPDYANSAVATVRGDGREGGASCLPELSR